MKIIKKLDENFKIQDTGIQYVKAWNKTMGHARQELKIDNDNKTFERGNFTFVSDHLFSNAQRYEDLIDELREKGYKEIKSGYQSLRRGSR